MLELQSKEAESTSTEVLELKENIENLKILLNNSEKKYVHLSTINMDLQNRINMIEQQSQLQTQAM